MDETAMAGIDPERRVEMRRRVRLIRDYVAGPRTAERREGAAAELGVTPGQFLRLVRIWRETGSPARLHGAGAPGRARRPTRSLAPGVEAIIGAAIDELGRELINGIHILG